MLALEPVAVGLFVSIWSSLWSKYILPALCAKCEEEDTSSNSAVSSDIEIHVESHVHQGL